MFSPQKVWSRRKDIAGSLMYWSGLSRGFEVLTQPVGAIILMYHSVAPDHLAGAIDPPNRLIPESFERQMAYLRRHRNVVSMTELVSQLEAGNALPAGTVCITFDDGYLDNLTTAAPILEKYELPATLFLPTAYIDRAETQWADLLHCCFANRTGNALDLPQLSLRADLSVEEQRARARRAVHLKLLQATYPERCDLFRVLKDQLQPMIPGDQLTMGWDDVRTLVRRYPRFEIGGHSQHHIDLKAHSGAFAQQEIVGCAKDIERELGVRPQHFSFPYGRWSDETRSMVRAAGWRSSVGASAKFRIDTSSDRFAMPRPATPNSMTDLRFRTSGAYPGVLAMIGLH